MAPAIAPFQLKATDAEILTLREGGLWARQIAVRTGMTTSAVKMRFQGFRDRGVSVPPAKGPRPNPLAAGGRRAAPGLCEPGPQAAGHRGGSRPLNVLYMTRMIEQAVIGPLRGMVDEQR